jgi:selenocysteine lyase/cysteine desulfurase/tRNA(Ile)-lysidine synthase TilS/MesJ
VELLIDCIGLKQQQHAERPVVFVGPYEHHSNLIPWRESGAKIVMVPEQCGTVDYEFLERAVQRPEYRSRTKMGTFTAASNVTGKLCNVDRIAAILHHHGALAFFDYATASSYIKIDMNPACTTDEYPSRALIAKDAVFISPHKMLGGVGTPGILIVKKHLVSQSSAPSRSGGGTVFYVTNTHHRFLSNRMERFEGGTPNVTGILRAGLTFLLKRQVDATYKMLRDRVRDNDCDGQDRTSIPLSIEECDFATHREVSFYLKKHAPNLVLLGDKSDDTSMNPPIFSFLIRFGKRFLHYNYVCAVLNDVFGIQSRGGCQCAGPYSQRLLGLSETIDNGEVPNEMNRRVEDALYRYKERAELLRPGYTRLSLPWKGTSVEEVDYVMKALVWVARNGWALMCQYRCNHRTGEWRHASRQGKPLGRDERKWLSHFDFSSSTDNDYIKTADHESLFSERTTILGQTLLNADKILASAKADQRSIAEAVKMRDAELVLGEDEDAKLEDLRWYAYPKECAIMLLSGKDPFESKFVLGALRPDSIDKLEYSNGLNDRKRKSPENANFVRKEGDLIIAERTNKLYFRDGEHSGEALLEEIAEGVKDGELSQHAQVFDSVRGEWLLFSSFIPASNNVEVVSNSLQSFGKSVENTELVTENKKAIRSSGTWGRPSVFPPMAQTTALPIDTAQQQKTSAKETCVQNKKSKFRHIRPPAKLMRFAIQAVMQWNMIEPGDKLLLGLSGGKDSLSLLHCLLELQRKLPVKFELEVCTIDPMTPSFDPSSLIPYVESLGLKYHYIRDDIVSRANAAGKNGKMVSSLCAYCARMKRGNLYRCARENKCNKLVLAQHLDDCAESIMMSMMHNGFLRTMKAHYAVDAGDLSVIRPLIYCRESLMTEFAKAQSLPVINENCPACFEEPKERARVKKLLSREESLYPNFYDNMRRSLIPLMHDDLSSILRAYTEDTVARSRKKPFKGPKGSLEREAYIAQQATGSEKGADFCTTTSIRDASDDDLVREIARRKAERYKRILCLGANGQDEATHIPDLTGQVCTLNGGNGTIPCRELME